jgi:glutamate--cysteine ligase
MTALPAKPAADPTAPTLHDRAAAEAYVASVCFKHGPPQLVGAELEWTVHYAGRPRRSLHLPDLVAALAAHAPTTVNPTSPQVPLRNGSLVTVEPGGQVEISAPPQQSLSTLLSAVAADAAELATLLDKGGLVLGRHGFDTHRVPTRLLSTPRYSAMDEAFSALGPDGLAWMCATAGLQVCLDVGLPDRIAPRWAAVNALGPVLSALFANTGPPAGQRDSWVSARMRAMLRADPARTAPVDVDEADPAGSWARLAVDAPVLCVRRPDGNWAPSRPVSFAEWIDGALDTKPTLDDLDYHLSTLFPPVRPRGYLEVRYLDSQPDGEWIAPVALLTALFADESTVDAALAAARPAADRWLPAARDGLADPLLAEAADAVLDVAITAIPDNTDLTGDAVEQVVGLLARRRRISGGERS